MKLATCCLLFLVLVVSDSWSQGVIKGSVVGHDGMPLEMASIQQLTNETNFPRAVIRRYEVAEDGSFNFHVTPPGLFRLQFSGLYHDDYELPIYLADPDTVELAVALGTPGYLTSGDSLTVYLIALTSGERSRTKVGIKNKDNKGRYIVPVPPAADTVFYSLYTRSGWRHGPVADQFIIDREGNYNSALLHENRHDTLLIDISRLPTEQTEPRFNVQNGPPNTQKFAEVYRDFEARKRKSNKYLREQRDKGIPTYDISYDWRKDIRDLKRQLRREEDPFKKQVRYLMLMRAEFSDEWLDWEPDRALAEEVIASIPPTSLLLSFDTFLIGRSLQVVSKPEKKYGEFNQDLIELQDAAAPYAEYIHLLSHAHPDSSVRRSFLGGAVGWAFTNKQFERFEEYYKEYMDAYSGTFHAEDMERRYKPQKDISPGLKVPEFVLTSMDDPSDTISSEELLGTNYLISFWATWCGPCITKMEDLERMYAHYEGADFTILSISMDFLEEHTREFRANKSPMPWLNAYLEGWKPDEGILKSFEVIGIPKTILVNKEGYIVAVETDKDAFYEAIISHMGY